jgi:cytochrome P450
MSSEALLERPIPAVKPRFIAPWRFVRPLIQARNGNFDAIRSLFHGAGPLFYTRIGMRRFHLVNDPDLVEEVLVTKHKCYHKDPGYSALRRLMGNGLLTSEGEVHLRHRRMIQPAFHKKRIDEYAACMVQFARDFEKVWEDGATRDINADMMNVTLSIIAKTMFDADVADDTKRVYDALNTVIHYSELYVNPTIGRIFDSLPIPASRRARAAERELNDIVYRFIREHRESGEDRGDLLSMLLLSTAEDGSGAMSDQQVRDEAITLFLAGHETTSIALSWTWYLLSQHPEVEARLHAELDDVLEHGRPATASDVAHLAYTRRVLTESMRLYPPAFAVGRQAICDNVIGGCQIRKGDLVGVPIMSLHHSEKYFPDPERFDPDRWTPERAAEVPKFAYFPFGGGVRKCIGEPFAWMEGILLLATFAQRWRFALAPDAKIGLEPKITLRPKYGMRMVLHRR